MTIDIHRTFDDAANLRSEWDAFVESVGGDIYLTIDWCRIWWKYYGEKRQLKIFVFRDRGEIVGLIPIFLETLWFGPTYLRVGRMLCSDFGPFIVNPPVREEYAEEIIAHVVSDLVELEKCDSVSFGPMTEGSGYIKKMVEGKQTLVGVRPISRRITSVCSVFPLVDSWDQYLRTLAKRQSSNLRRDLNLLSRSFDISQRVLTVDSEVSAAFEKFVIMHTAQWNAEGKLGHFLDWPNATEFNSDLVVSLAKLGRVRFVELKANEEVVSMQLCFTFGARWHWRLPARLAGPKWFKYGLGRVGLAKLLEVAMQEGAHVIEGGPGHYDYKVKLGAREDPLYSCLLVRNRWDCQVRARLFLTLASALDFFYYRVWFLRLAPKLPFKRHALSRLWIRSRF